MSNINLNDQPFSGLKQQSFSGLKQQSSSGHSEMALGEMVESSATCGVDDFQSFEEVKTFIRRYEDENCIQTTVAHSRTIEGARNRGFKGYVSSDLKYTEILYKCIHGSSRKSRSTGKRPNQSTYRQQCPFFIRFKANGDKLVIADKNEDHNHLHNKETKSFLPHHRILDDATKEYAKKVLSLRPNKKLLQVELQKATNKNILLRDLHNLGSKKNSDDSLQATLEYLKRKEDSVVELVKNEENILLAIFYQDKEMQRLFHCYPEILFVDAIHKVCDRRMPLYILLVEDGNGDSEIVGFYLVASEDKNTMKQLPNFLKKHNTGWENIKSIMTDKDFVERDIFLDAFPQAKLLICLFHCLRAFRREITTEKMGITSGERDRCLEILQKLAYSQNEEEYSSNLRELEEINIKPVIDYHHSNWHPIRAEWVVGLQQSNTVTFGNRTNNRLEAINSKVVQVVKRNSKLQELFENLDKLLISLRMERDFKAAKIQLKVPFPQDDIDNSQRQYMQHLTPYAYGLVAEQYRCKEKVEVLEENGNFTVQSREGLLNVSADTCCCTFFKSMQLPCRHILKVREITDLDCFSKNLCSIRWSKNYYTKNSRVVAHEADNTEATTGQIGMTKVKTKRVTSQFEKFSLAAKKTAKLASLASEAPSRLFPQRLKVLDYIIDMWEKGEEVAVSAVHQLQNEVEQISSPLELSTIVEVDESGRDQVEENTSPSSPTAVESTSDILPVLPPKIKKRGRPKGAEMTVIGLPMKKRRSDRVVSFERKHPKTRDLIILQWFVSRDNANKAISGGILDEEAVEQNPNLVSSACLDEKVCLSSVRKYFTADGWLSIQHVVEIKKKSPLWLCPCCKTDSKENTISCDSCLEWFHLKCTNLKSFPKKKQWFCFLCKRN